MFSKTMDIKQQNTLNPWKLETDEVNPNINFYNGKVLEMEPKKKKNNQI